MFNVKWSVYPAAAAFALSLVVGLVFSGGGFGLALLRAFLFGALFFGIGSGAWILISSHVPELLAGAPRREDDEGVFPGVPAEASPADPPAGSMVSVTVGDSGEPALPEALPGGSFDISSIGNIADLVSGEAGKGGDVDQAPANGYTPELGSLDFAPGAAKSREAPPAAPADSGGLGDFSSFLDGMSVRDTLGEADDSLAELFQSLPGDGRSGQDDGFQPERKRIGETNPMEIKGDFSPKEIAMGLRTALAKDKRG